MNRMPPWHLPVEPTFNEFVEKTGGELIEKILPPQKGQKRADYLFRTPGIIAELKCLEHDPFTRDYQTKLQALVNSWQARGLIRIYGTVQLDVRQVLHQCQTEWLNITEQPLNRNIISKASRQIRDTKAALGLPEAKGVLLLANDGNRSMTPSNIFFFLKRILSKKKDDGAFVCSSLHWIVLFSTNVPVMIDRDPRPMMFWTAAHRFGVDSVISRFLAEMNVGWNRHCAEKRGVPLKEVNLGGANLDDVRFV
jgi:hypothetical protein